MPVLYRTVLVEISFWQNFRVVVFAKHEDLVWDLCLNAIAISNRTGEYFVLIALNIRCRCTFMYAISITCKIEITQKCDGWSWNKGIKDVFLHLKNHMLQLTRTTPSILAIAVERKRHKDCCCNTFFRLWRHYIGCSKFLKLIHQFLECSLKDW